MIGSSLTYRQYSIERPWTYLLRLISKLCKSFRYMLFYVREQNLIPNILCLGSLQIHHAFNDVGLTRWVWLTEYTVNRKFLWVYWLPMPTTGACIQVISNMVSEDTSTTQREKFTHFIGKGYWNCSIL